jgi:hypothetical protein
MLEVLALVPDTSKRRGRRYALVFILAVAVACVLAQAKSFREIGDHAADLPQQVLARLGGTPHPLLRRIAAPSEKWAGLAAIARGQWGIESVHWLRHRVRGGFQHRIRRRRAAGSRSAPGASRRCGGCWTASVKMTGATRLTWTMPRSPWRPTGRTGGLPPRGC